jgi:hypothetical protein
MLWTRSSAPAARRPNVHFEQVGELLARNAAALSFCATTSWVMTLLVGRHLGARDERLNAVLGIEIGCHVGLVCCAAARYR